MPDAMRSTTRDDKQPVAASRLLPRGREAWAVLREVWQRYFDDHLSLSAAGISFFTIISLIPLALFAVMVPSFLVGPGVIEEHTRALSAQLPAALGEALLTQVHYFVHHRHLFALLALGVGLWSGSVMFLHLETAINIIWRTRRTRGFWKSRLLAFLMVLLVGTLMFGAAFLINVLRILDHFQVTLMGRHVQEISWVFTTLITVVVPILLMTALFTASYCILPVRTVTLRTVIPGAVAAAVLWAVSLHLFSLYAARFANYQFVYGSLGGTVLMMAWLYVSALIMLLGAEVSAVYHHRLLRDGDRTERQIALEESNLPALDDPDLL